MKVSVMMIIMFTTAVGAILGGFLLDNVQITQITGLSTVQMAFLSNAVIWFLISVITWFGATRVEDKSFGLISLNFLIGWIFCNLGYILGFLTYSLIKDQSITVRLDDILTTFFMIMPLTIGPTLASSVGLKES